MGYMRHHCIVVTSFMLTDIEKARCKALEVFGRDTGRRNGLYNAKEYKALVSPIMKSMVNEYYTLFIAPDGSKEGWDESNHGDKAREEFTAWLKEERRSGCGYYTWFIAQYGDENGVDEMLDGSAERFEKKERIGGSRIDKEIVEQTEKLARHFYKMMGYIESNGFLFRNADHPQARQCWRMAVAAQEELTKTDVENAVTNMEE